jgi:hypothetical protein
MKLYRIAGHGWAGTQAEAKAEAKEFSTLWRPVEVPTDKPGLLAWLNDENHFAPPQNIDPEGTPLVHDLADLADTQLAPPPCNTPGEASGRCARCNGVLSFTATAALATARSLDLAAFDDWLATVGIDGLDKLQLAGEALRARVREIGGKLDAGTEVVQ